MRRMKKKLLIWILFFALLPDIMPETAKAEVSLKESMTISKIYSGSVDGVERTLFAGVLEDGTTSQYIRIGDAESNLLWYGNLDVGIDQYGAVWMVASNHAMLWWSYDLEPTFDSAFTTMGFWSLPNPNYTDSLDDEEVYDAESLIFEGTGEQAIVTGYKTFSGEIYSLPSFDKMKEIADVEEPIPEPLYIPKGMETLITPRPNPTPKPTTPVPGTPKPTPDKPAFETPTPVSKTPVPSTVNTKLTVKKNSLYEGDTLVSKYTLKKGVLRWKGKNKGKAFGVKYAGYIKKSKNLVYITKKGAAYTVSFKTGKKKLIVKKKRKAKKLIKSGKFVIKIKTASGKVGVRNK